MLRTWQRLGALLFSLVLVAAACGTNDGGGADTTDGGAATPAPGGSEAPAESAPAVEISGDLTIWAMGNEGALLGSMADRFMEEYPDVSVSVTPIDWGQAVTRLQTAIAGSQTPDVSQMGTDMMGQFVATGAIEPVGEGFDQAAFFESAWNTNVIDDVAYGVPWYVETRVLYYRTDIAEEAGITSAPTTWDELKTMAQAMQQEGGARWGISLGTKNYQEYAPFFWSNGGQILNDAGEFALDSPEGVEALEFYDSFFEDGLSPTEVPEGFDITPAFVTGTHPMFFSGPWHVGLITAAGGADFEGKWAVAPLPTKTSATSFVGGANLVVYQDSQNKDAAWAFVQFMTRPENQVAWYEEATVLPAVQAAWDDPTLSGDENVAVFGEQLSDTQAPPAIPTWNEVANAINEQMEQVTVGNASPADGAAAMQQAATGIGIGR